MTRVIGTDYFGESKKGGLRMWNKLIFDQGGLALHAGCKIYPNVNGEEKLALVIGLSGTGKTTTTFHNQYGSLPVQDDFCALLPGGKIQASENGCFAKTIGINPKDEPTIYHALTKQDAWLENVTVLKNGKVDFFDGSYTTNGRGTFPLTNIPHRDPQNLPHVNYIFLLNRNFNIIPAVAKLKLEQAPAYFMLGETTGTSAGGAAESGKSLRVPGTNPFFIADDALQANRFNELIKHIPDIEIYLLNTGRIGGFDDNSKSKKIKIKHSSAIIKAIVEGNIIWEEDSHFGYYVAKIIKNFKDADLLQPIKLYKKQGRISEYLEIVAKLKHERKKYLQSYNKLSPEITRSIK